MQRARFIDLTINGIHVKYLSPDGNGISAEAYERIEKSLPQVDQKFYSDNFIEMPVLDKFVYKGKGRPRKTDYSPLSTIQKKLNSAFNTHISKKR